MNKLCIINSRIYLINSSPYLKHRHNAFLVTVTESVYRDLLILVSAYVNNNNKYCTMNSRTYLANSSSLRDIFITTAIELVNTVTLYESVSNLAHENIAVLPLGEGAIKLA